jgi:hypothetical protein
MVVAQMPRCHSDLAISVVTERRTDRLTDEQNQLLLTSLAHVRRVTIIKGEPRHAIMGVTVIVRSACRS